MKIRRYLTQIYLLGTLLSAAATCSGLAQVLFFDNFQQFANGAGLSSTNYTPVFGPLTASVVTAVQNGSPTLTVSNFLGNTWILFNNSVPTNKNQYEGILSSVQTNQPLQITWNMWIAATNTGPGMFQLSVPTSDPNTNFNPLIFFTDSGSIIALTNGTSVQIPIGSWGSLAGTVMTNTLILDYPDGIFSYSLNGQTLATLPLGPYFTNVIGAVYFNGFERSAGSLGNRFALGDVEVEAFTPSNIFTYTANTGSITITGYTGTNTTVIIPDTINGLPVTSIGSYAFENKTTLTSMTIPSSVTNIGVAAFAFCNSLTNVTIPGSVASIGGLAFRLDTNLTQVYFLGNAPSADYSVFSGASGLVYYVPGTTGWTNSIGGLPAIPWFQPNPVILGSNHGLGVKTNGFGFTVSWATNLSIIVEATTNPANLFWTPVATNTLSNGFFYFLDRGWTNYSSRCYRLARTNVFTFFTASPTNGVLSLAVQFSSSNIDSLGNTLVGWHWNFGDGTTSAAQNPSHTYTNVGIFNPGFTATNSNGGTVAGYGPQIATFSFLTTTNKGAITITGFSGSLVSALTIPGTLNGQPVTGIGPRAFYFCPGLTNVTIPASVAGIGDYAFNSCGSLNSVGFGAGVTNIGNFAFTFDSSLTGLTLPSGVTIIGSNAFEYCTGLTSITIPDSVTSLGDFAFGYCGGLSDVMLGNGITNIGNFAFTFCTSLTSITIPENVTGIGISAFYSCSNLASVTIDGGNIGDYAFGYCGIVSNIMFGSSVTNIGNFAFTFDSSLTGLTIPNNVTTIGDSAFFSCASLANLTVGADNIGDYAFSACGSLSSVVIGGGVQNVGVGAFADCSSLPSVTISGGVASLGGDAFGGDTSLTRIYFLGNAPTADATVFSGIPGSVYYLPGATGWTSLFAGLPAELWNPVIQTGDGSFGVQSNQFGFTITGAANLPVVVEACTNLANPTWIPLLAGTLTNGSLYFSDLAWAYYPERFYRISAQ